MSIALIAVVVGNYKLEHKLNLANDEIHVLEIDKFQLGVEIETMIAANEAAIALAHDSGKVVEKKVVEIKKVYVPQIEYIDRYVGDKNETNCNDVNGLLQSVVY